MMARILLAALAAILLLSASSPTASASDEEVHPIWWSPELELESLDRIDERLERSFSPDGEGLVMDKWDGDRVVAKDRAPNCATMIDLDAKGYSPTGSSNDVAIQMIFLAECETIARLKDAKPAQQSFLRDFVLDDLAPYYLPGMMSTGGECARRCLLFEANEKRIPWSRIDDFVEIEYVDDWEMNARSGVTHFRVQILAQGDFNDDGLDDMFIAVSGNSIEGTYARTDLFLLTRGSADAVFYVLDDKQPYYDCECGPPSDYPEYFDNFPPELFID